MERRWAGGPTTSHFTFHCNDEHTAQFANNKTNSSQVQCEIQYEDDDGETEIGGQISQRITLDVLESIVTNNESQKEISPYLNRVYNQQ